MKLSFNDILYAFSYALDCVEHELLGVTTNHGKRVAYLCVLMGEQLGFSKDSLMDLSACAVLHDNALTEYIQAEYRQNVDVLSDKGAIKVEAHCDRGERNMELLPLCSEAKNAVLYHHENADGSGPFGKNSKEVPVFAELIHIADQIDAGWDLSVMNHEKYIKLIDYLETNRDKLFSTLCVESFKEAVTYKKLLQIQEEGIAGLLQDSIEDTVRDYRQSDLRNFAKLFAGIIDYKSGFTMRHSMGIAEKAEYMAKYYGFNELDVTKMFFAGAVHDIGKLVVDKDILEKPDKLTSEEYKHIQNHAYGTYRILTEVKGMEDITNWAALHHEKLNGKGYPFGKTGAELGLHERLMACIDVYQALTEERPYKEGMTHEASMKILRNMVADGSLDEAIVDDIEKVYGSAS